MIEREPLKRLKEIAFEGIEGLAYKAIEGGY